jgi:hypothetical protein
VNPAAEVLERYVDPSFRPRLADLAQKSSATTNRELELLRRALRLAHDRQLLPSIPR